MHTSGALTVTVSPLDDPGDLVSLLPDERPLTWIRGGDGLVGWGTAAVLRTSGPDRFDLARQAWAELTEAAEVDDPIALPGTGLVAFGTADFRAEGELLLVVPQVVVGRRDGRAWRTTIGPQTDITPTRPTPPATTAFADGRPSAADWQEIVAGAVAHIEAGTVAKVVLARSVIATAEAPIDVRVPLAQLAERYRDCWTFCVDGFFGATPEMLVRLRDNEVSSRVLAGTVAAGDDPDGLGRDLLASAKDRGEHAFAVDSVTAALTGLCTDLEAPTEPSVLRLPNVLHLASDVHARTDHDVLGLVEALHPSAAVGGTPTADALALIERIEQLDRGRYAGPVGWIDAAGDGEWGIGLRSAQLSADRRRAELFAGCGIVADSVPAEELAETVAKLRPMREALG